MLFILRFVQNLHISYNFRISYSCFSIFYLLLACFLDCKELYMLCLVKKECAGLRRTLCWTWIRETRCKTTCSFCTVLFWDLTYNRRIIVYHTLKIRISRWEGYRISSPIGWRNSRVISLENPNSDWTIPHNSAISRGIYEQRKDEIENGFLLSFTDSGWI